MHISFGVKKIAFPKKVKRVTFSRFMWRTRE